MFMLLLREDDGMMGLGSIIVLDSFIKNVVNGGKCLCNEKVFIGINIRACSIDNFFITSASVRSPV